MGPPGPPGPKVYKYFISSEMKTFILLVQGSIGLPGHPGFNGEKGDHGDPGPMVTRINSAFHFTRTKHSLLRIGHAWFTR